jgi:integrase
MHKPERCGKCGAEPELRKECGKCGESVWVLRHTEHYMGGSREIVPCRCSKSGSKEVERARWEKKKARITRDTGKVFKTDMRSRTARRVESKDGSVLISEYIFHRKGQRICSFRKAWANACKFANVEGRLFHDLRRCAARNLVASGVPQVVAMKITGHKTDSMFRRYAVVTVEQQREALRAAQSYREQQVAVEAGKPAPSKSIN